MDQSNKLNQLLKKVVNRNSQTSQASNHRGHIYDNRHFSSFHYYIEELINRYPNDVRRRYSCLTLANLILYNNIKGEFYNRNVFIHGDLYNEDTVLYELCEKKYDISAFCINQYLNQSREDSEYSEVNWSIYFLTEYLITELMYHQADSTYEHCPEEWYPTLKQNKDDYMDAFSCIFYGLFPIIEESSHEISSHMYIKYTTDFNYGFLIFPPHIADNFRCHIPGFLHEIFHYIPPESRITRNKTVLSLFIHAILNEWRQALYEKLHAVQFDSKYIQLVYNLYFENLYNYFIAQVQRYSNAESHIVALNGTNLDSMLLEIVETYCIYRTSPKYFCQLLRETPLDDVPEATDTIEKLYHDPSIMERMERNWWMVADRFAITYNNLLREIRADISMSLLLDINLKEYIRIMAQEERFARDNKSIVGDTVVLRFGFMTRFLWERQQHPEDNFIFSPISSKQELDNWMSACTGILSCLTEETTESSMYDPNHIQNLLDYLELYCEMVIETQPDSFYEQYTSPLENELAGSENAEVNRWVKNIQHIASSKFKSIEWLKKWYDQRNDIASRENIYQTIYNTSTDGLLEWNTNYPYRP